MRLARNLLALGCALNFGATFAAMPALAQDNKPNVVFILADNVGYGDLGSYGGGELRGAPTPNLDQLAREGLRLTQYLVEPACTPSRAALMTGQYSIRNGLSLIAVPGSPNTLSARAYTMGEMFKGVGYATAIFGKWHLGSEPQSLPTAHGFDEFYGIPPDTSWDSATYVDSLIAFATQPDNVTFDGGGRNSPFAKSLLGHLGTVGQNISGGTAMVHPPGFCLAS
jgi:arylsulfatase